MILLRHAVLGALLAAVVALMARPAAAAGSEIVTAARLGVHDSETRFVLELTGKAPYQLAFETGPHRIVIDLPKLSWQPRKTSVRAADGLVARYSFVEEAGKGRLVLELREPAKVRNAMYIAPESGHDWRLVLDLAPASKAEFEHLAAESAAKAQPKVVEAKPAPKTVTQTQAQAEPPKITVPQPEPPKPAVVPKPEVPKLEAKGLTPKAESPPLPQASMAPVKPAESAHGQTAPADVKKPDIKIAMATPPPAVASLVRPPVAPKLEPKLPPSVLPPPRPDAPIRPVIVIDAGHGGADPGAQATDGTKEKDIVLNAALAVAKALEKSGRYSVVLTRSTDTTLKLRERVDVSRANHGDLFVSLHANLFEKSAAVSGLSIYTLSDRATSKAAAELASKENRADLIAGVDLSHENDDVTHILIDLAQHETLNRSVQFAHQLVETVQRTTPLEKNTGQQASLVVLKAPDVPSVLVELGYLTNDADLARMKSDVWIGQFADAFVAAVDRHFQIKNARRDEPAVLR